VSKKPFTECPTCGTPHVDESHSLILYFPDKTERDLFVEMAKRELKTATVYPVDRPNAEAN